MEDIIDDVVNNLSEELEKTFTDLKQEKQSFEDFGITVEEKAFYDILVAVAENMALKSSFRKIPISSWLKRFRYLLATNLSTLTGRIVSMLRMSSMLMLPSC